MRKPDSKFVDLLEAVTLWRPPMTVGICPQPQTVDGTNERGRPIRISLLFVELYLIDNRRKARTIRIDEPGALCMTADREWRADTVAVQLDRACHDLLRDFAWSKPRRRRARR